MQIFNMAIVLVLVGFNLGMAMCSHIHGTKESKKIALRVAGITFVVFLLQLLLYLYLV